MSKEVDALTLIRGDFDRAVKPSLVESYSFEYAYRLFLILCSSKPGVISSLSEKELNELESFFQSGLETCIETASSKKGLEIDDALRKRYAGIATTTLMRYLKGGMEPDSTALAKQVAKSLEKHLYSDGVLEPDIKVVRVFLEPRA